MAGFRDLLAYKKAFSLAMRIFELSKKFPKEETYSLTDQIRRSSRSVTANFAVGYRKRKYPAHFVLKMTDSDAENSETSVWLDYALKCKYITQEDHSEMIQETVEIGRLLKDIIDHPEKYSRVL